MPEYLAPGVYVEETSFRAKSIEGVGTSTTAFVGPTLKGPVGGTPELLTSFGDFERTYGGLDDLSFGTNYLAHAVRAFFNEGGSRLYVSRVAAGGGGQPASVVAITASGGVGATRFVARTTGTAGNGRIVLRLQSTLATKTTLENAPPGTLVRRGLSPATPASVLGGLPPFSVANNAALRLSVGSGGIAENLDITFTGAAAEVSGTVALGSPVVLNAANPTLQVTISGVPQTIPLVAAPTPAEFVTDLNQKLRGGYARLTVAADGGAAGRLVIGTDVKGKAARLVVSANADLGFVDATVPGTGNVGDLGAVPADELDQLLAAAGVAPRQVRASLRADGRLVLSTIGTGAAATLAVADQGPGSAHTALGLTAGGAPATGKAGASAPTYYLKRNATYLDSANAPLDLAALNATANEADKAEILTLSVVAEDRTGTQVQYDDLGFDPSHPRYAGTVLAKAPASRYDQLQNLFALETGAGVTAFNLWPGLFPAPTDRLLTLSQGSDGGAPPGSGDYDDALKALEQLDDVSIVAAPGSSAYPLIADAVQKALIAHAERRRAYRIAVLDTPPGQSLTQARENRSRIDSKYAALYYPWVVVANPLARPGNNLPTEITLPPSGFLCGIYARSDIERGVYKAPANEVVRSALRFETDINFAQQEVLNPLGVNCLRFFPGRGYRVWGARTASSDPEWKYVNVRRYFLYLEASIDSSTQWAVFEPNGERLWANVRDTLTAFLYNEWVSGALLGGSPREAFFVKCDRSTMTQNDLDNGRLICLIGVAALKPAEFVIFRIGQKTAEAT